LKKLVPAAALALLFAASLRADEGASAVTEMSWFYTSGEPRIPERDGFEAKEPDIRYTARKTKDGFEIVVRVNTPMEGVKITTDFAGPLTQEEWDSLLKIVKAGKLETWTLEKMPEPAPDWGTMGYTVKGKEEHRETWDAPLEEKAPPMALVKALTDLAKRKIEKLPKDLK